MSSMSAAGLPGPGLSKLCPMLLQILSGDLSPISIDTNLHDNTQNDSYRGSYVWNTQTLELQVRRTQLGIVVLANLIAWRTEQIRVMCDQPAVVLHLATGGRYMYQVDGLKPFQLHERTYNIYYSPKWMVTMNLEPAISKSLLVIMAPSAFERMESQHPIITSFIGSAAMQRHTRLFAVTPFANCRMLLAALVLGNEDLHAEFESAAAALVRMALRPSKKLKQKRQTPMEEAQILALYKIKEMIVGDLKRDYRYEELADSAGITVWQLRKGFPELFGASVFELQKEYRMLRAANMLLEIPRPTLKEVANAVGFSEPSPFIRAFKRFFGQLPATFRIECTDM